MKIISFNVSEPYRKYILNGQKKVEGRLKKGKFSELKKGDCLTLANDNIKFEVVEINYYKSFKDMIIS